MPKKSGHSFAENLKASPCPQPNSFSSPSYKSRKTLSLF